MKGTVVQDVRHHADCTSSIHPRASARLPRDATHCAGVTPWSARDLYESQSPVHNAPKIKTPFLILQGTTDGSVDAGQGLEFYAAARRRPDDSRDADDQEDRQVTRMSAVGL
jgi:alpha-beta hydrolase superfamily lysophospholipase